MLHFGCFGRVAGWLALAALGLSLAGCDPAAVEWNASSLPPQKFQGVAPIRIVATVGMVADVVQGVGGEHVSVTALMGPGVDPHLYKPSRDDVRMVLRADLVVYSGLFLEGKLVDTLQKVSRRRPVWALTDGLEPDRLLGGSATGGHPDPHVWMDVGLWSRAAWHLAEKFSEFDPEHAAVYRDNASRYCQQLQDLDQYARQVLQSIPEPRRIFLTSHDAFQYFGRAYGLQVLGIQGISTESEAGLRRVNDLVDLLVARQVPAVFFESSVPQRSIEAIVAGARSRGHQVTICGPLFSDAMGEAGTYEGTYLGMMDHNITLVARSLGGTAPLKGWRGQLSGQNTAD